jgi:hypothetical protein
MRPAGEDGARGLVYQKWGGEEGRMRCLSTAFTLQQLCDPGEKAGAQERSGLEDDEDDEDESVSSCLGEEVERRLKP